MRRKILIYLGVSALFTVIFIVAVIYALPTESIRHFAEKTIEKQLKHEQAIEIGDLKLSPLMNVTLKNVSITPRISEPVADTLKVQEGEYNGIWCSSYVEDMPFFIDEIFVNPSIIKIAKKKPEGKFEIKIRDGKIDGNLRSNNGSMELNANAESISLPDLTLLSNKTKMQIHGDMDFTTRAVIEKNALKELNFESTIANVAICPARIKTNNASMPFFPLPFTYFGDIEADIEIAGDKLTINKLTSTGDLKLDITGTVMLKSVKNPTPHFNIKGVIQPNAEWIKDNNMKFIYQYCEKHSDGSIHLTATGTTKKHEIKCGTPIPEELTEEEKAAIEAKRLENEQKRKEAEEKKQAEKEEKKKAAEEEKERLEKAKAEEKKNQESENVKPSGVFKRDPDDVRQHESTGPRTRTSFRGRNRNSEANDGSEPPERLDRLERGRSNNRERNNGERLNRNLDTNRPTNRLDENIDREISRRNRRENRRRYDE